MWVSVSEQDFSNDRPRFGVTGVTGHLVSQVSHSRSHTNLDLSNIKSFFKYRISYVSKRLILHFNVNLDWDSNYGYVIPVQGNIEV